MNLLLACALAVHLVCLADGECRTGSTFSVMPPMCPLARPPPRSPRTTAGIKPTIEFLPVKLRDDTVPSEVNPFKVIDCVDNEFYTRSASPAVRAPPRPLQA